MTLAVLYWIAPSKLLRSISDFAAELATSVQLCLVVFRTKERIWIHKRQNFSSAPRIMHSFVLEYILHLTFPVAATSI